MNPGMSPAVQQAMQRRGIGASAPQLSQVSAQAPMQNPLPQPSNPSDASKSSSIPAAAPQKWQPQNQQDFVVSALVEQLKNTNSLEKEKLKMAQQPPIPQPSIGALPTAQTAPSQASPLPMGGGGSSYGWDNPMFSGKNTESTPYFDLSQPSTSNRQKQNVYGM